MQVRALNSHAVAIALAAISFASSAGAGPLLCDDVNFHSAVWSSCRDGDKDFVKNKHRIDHLFAEDWKSIEKKFKSGSPKFDDRPVQLWAPLGSSVRWDFGSVLDGRGKWAQAQLHGGQPSQNVPEPSTMALLGIGLIGAALSRRRKHA